LFHFLSEKRHVGLWDVVVSGATLGAYVCRKARSSKTPWSYSPFRRPAPPNRLAPRVLPRCDAERAPPHPACSLVGVDMTVRRMAALVAVLTSDPVHGACAMSNFRRRRHARWQPGYNEWHRCTDPQPVLIDPFV
jgi:hypothetical protein